MKVKEPLNLSKVSFWPEGDHERLSFARPEQSLYFTLLRVDRETVHSNGEVYIMCEGKIFSKEIYFVDQQIDFYELN